MLECSALSLRLGSRPVLHELSLRVGQGQRVALMGPNGSGKSSLLRAMAGLLEPSAGAILFQGQTLSHLAPWERAAQIACVFQVSHVAFDFEVRQIVAMGKPQPDPQGVQRALEAVGLGPLAERRWSRCSGGEQQRAHIARALHTGARLLLLDEPSNHLDLGAKAQLIALLGPLAQRGAVALATHDLDLAGACDVVALLGHGRLLTLGTPAEVFSAPSFSQCFGLEGPSALRPTTRPLGPPMTEIS